MKRRLLVSSALLATPFVLLTGGQPGCSSNNLKAVGLGVGCSLNSDCNNPLVCVFGLCHEACAVPRDCPAGQTCVASGNVNVCTLPPESSCTDAGACLIDTLSCDAVTQKCVNPCTTSGCPVSGQVCQNGLCEDAPDGGADASVGDGPKETSTPRDSSMGADGADVDGSMLVESGPPTDAGPLGFFPSNLPVGAVPSIPADAGDAGVVVTASCTNGTAGCPLQTPMTLMQNDGSPVDLYVVNGLLIDTTQTLTLVGPNPVIIASLGPVYIDGTLNVGSHLDLPGAGGFPPTTPGPGAGQPGVGATSNSGGGGGSYCGVGGTGINMVGQLGAVGGPTYGNASIIPLLGGSAGGSLGGGPSGGAGGGAIQIVSSVSISIGAEGIIAAGAGGATGGGLSGGGSGGSILLEAPTVTVSGTLEANGGGGGPGGADALQNAQPATGGLDNLSQVVGGSGSAGTTLNGGPGMSNTNNYAGGGGGGAGRIRINTSGGSANITTGGAVITPDSTTACFSQGKTGS